MLNQTFTVVQTDTNVFPTIKEANKNIGIIQQLDNATGTLKLARSQYRLTCISYQSSVYGMTRNRMYPGGPAAFITARTNISHAQTYHTYKHITCTNISHVQTYHMHMQCYFTQTTDIVNSKMRLAISL